MIVDYYLSIVLICNIFLLKNVQKSNRLLLQLIEILMSDNPMDVDAIVKLIDSILNFKSIEVDQQVLYAQRKLEYLEEFGKDIVM